MVQYTTFVMTRRHQKVSMAQCSACAMTPVSNYDRLELGNSKSAESRAIVYRLLVHKSE